MNYYLCLSVNQLPAHLHRLFYNEREHGHLRLQKNNLLK